MKSCTPIFQQLPFEILKQLQSTLKEEDSSILINNPIIQLQANFKNTNKYQQKCLAISKLTIKNEYIVQIGIDTKKILSGFKCDFSIKFQFIRTTQLSEDAIGRIIGIKFFFQNQQKVSFPVTIYFQTKFNELCNLEEKFKQIDIFCQILQRKFIVQKGFHQTFKAIKKIGKGVTASVFSAQRLTDKIQVAVKSFKKQDYFKLDGGKGKIAFLKEFKIMTLIQNKYLCKLLSVYQSQNSIYIVVQLLNRTLYKYLQKFNFPQPKLCKSILFKLLIGLKVLHSKKIMHRDLKLQNIMVRGQDKDNVEPVIIDFGLAQYVQSTDFTYMRCGTPGYAAPQIVNIPNHDIQTRYNQLCDIFSLGVIFHILLIGRPVFQGENIKIVIQKNRKCEIDYQFKGFPGLRPQVKDLLSKMLQKDPKKRINVDQIIKHQFFSEQRQIYKNEVEQFSINHQKQLNNQKTQSKNTTQID